MVYDFGLRLRQLREKRGLSQAEAGARMGLSRSGISNYESNISQPSIDVLKTLAAFYRTSTDYLLGLDNRDIIIMDGISEEQSKAMHIAVDAILDQFNKQK